MNTISPILGRFVCRAAIKSPNFGTRIKLYEYKGRHTLTVSDAGEHDVERTHWPTPRTETVYERFARQFGSCVDVDGKSLA
jgi:hypothetical protein